MSKFTGPAKLSSTKVQASGLTLQAWYIEEDKIAPGHNFHINFTIKNKSPFKPHNETCAIGFEEDGYFSVQWQIIPTPIKPGGTVTVRYDAVAKPHDNLEHLPVTKAVNIIDTQENILFQTNLAFSIDPYVRHLSSLKPPLKVLLWGLIGTGKSSFVNSAYSLLAPDPNFPTAVQKWQLTMSAPESVTKRVTRLIPGAKSDRPIPADVNVSFIDTWGWESSKDNYPSLFFQYLLSGGVPDNFDLSRVKNFKPEDFKVDPSLAVNAVFIAMTVGSAQNDKYLDMISKIIINELNKRKLIPVVLLTQIDLVEPTLRNDPYLENPPILDLRRKVAAVTNIPVADIVPVVNYTEEGSRTFAIDRSIYVALQKAFLYSNKGR